MHVHSSLPSPTGEQLWLVHLMGSYYDNDPRGGGTNPVDIRLWVIARSHSGALRKAEEKIGEYRRTYHYVKNFEVTAQPCPLEILLPARNSEHDGRLGYYSTTKSTKVELTLPQDQKRYRLAVCLVEYDDGELED